MTAGRRMLGGLLLVVAVAAAVLSFSALRDLAEACGFSDRLAWLLPVVVDAGAAAGSVVWLGGQVTHRARRFARGLALTLLLSSVAANALGHGFAAYGARPHWTVVVLVSAIAPAVLGAVVHLAVLVGRAGSVAPEEVPVARPVDTVDDGEDLAADDELVPDGPDPVMVDERGLSLNWADAPLPEDEAAGGAAPDRADRLIAEGAGRRRLARELDITEHAARELLAARRNGHDGVNR